MKDESITPIISSEPQPQKYFPPRQSANTLFRFFRKPKYLYGALKQQALTPRYYVEETSYLGIGHDRIAYPIICFCDINIHRLSEHIHLYGGYGIAFSKEWGISHGIQPLQYINENSILRRDFATAFDSAVKSPDSPLADYLLTQMLFLKPIEGPMPRKGEIIEKNFTDEQEWRYVPNISTLNLPPVVLERDLAGLGVLNKTLEKNNCCWLRFDFSDIKYIILESYDDFSDFCSIVDEAINSQDIKRRLISKVIIWQDAKEDF